MKLSDFDYDLPEELIAQKHATPRSYSRLMIVGKKKIEHKRFFQIVDHVKRGDVIVINTTAVVKNKFYGKKSTGAHVSVIIEQPIDEFTAICRVQGTSSVKQDNELLLDNGVKCRVIQKQEQFWLHFDTKISSFLNTGEFPSPPYIRRSVGNEYQTIYAKQDGSLAAPTAGLHFTPHLMRTLVKKGACFAHVTLHVGFGTFKPIRTEDYTQHTMHPEWYSISEKDASVINHAQRLLVVGTTTMKALETATVGGKVFSGSGKSKLFIYPGYRFKLKTAGLITNFHLPKSTLLLLVSAYAGKGRILKAYEQAVHRHYQFFSLGDAMFLEHF